MMNRMTGSDLPDVQWLTACGENNSCVEVGRLTDGAVAMRNSTDQEGPVLVFTAGEWTDFTAGVVAGKFNEV